MLPSKLAAIVTAHGLLEQRPMLRVNVFFTDTANELGGSTYQMIALTYVDTASSYLIRALPSHLAARNAQ